MIIEFKKNREIFDFIYRKLDNANKSIKVAVAWFTDPELSKLLLEKKKQNIDIQVVLFNDQINSHLKFNAYGNCLYFSNILSYDYIMHHKFCIIDNELVITGSYNWTVKARRYNRENILCIRDENVIEQFNNEFENLLKNSTVQSQVNLRIIPNSIDKIENVEILNLEKLFNEEIYLKIEETAKINIGVNIDLAYQLVAKHTPVIAAKRLAESQEGQLIQSGLRKATEANRLDLSFEASIVKLKYANLFDKETIRLAKLKLEKLGFFTNEIYSKFWNEYD